MMKSKKNILLSLFILLILFLCIGALFFLHTQNRSGETALIYQEGNLIRRVSLTDVKEPYQFQIDSKDGGYNLVRVENGAIGIIDADCPDKICEQRGMVSDTGYPITACRINWLSRCSTLPHLLMILMQLFNKKRHRAFILYG